MKLSLFIASFLVSFAMHGTAFAQTSDGQVNATENVNDSVEDLSVQKESDELDVFDQKEIEAETKKETSELMNESKHLERDIDRLHAQSKGLSQSIGKQSSNYSLAAKNYRKIESEMKHNQASHDHLKSELEKLNDKVSKLRERVNKARVENARLASQVRSQKRAKARLEAKKKQAESELKRQNEVHSKLRSQG